jgi:hypothetical protein
MLVTFGTFWAGEGLGIKWPLADLFLIVLILFYLSMSGLLVLWLKKHRRVQTNPEPQNGGKPRKNIVLRTLWEIFDFFCGDWTVFWGIALTLILTIMIRRVGALAFALPVTGIVYIGGISISFLTALCRRQPSA